MIMRVQEKEIKQITITEHGYKPVKACIILRDLWERKYFFRHMKTSLMMRASIETRAPELIINATRSVMEYVRLEGIQGVDGILITLLDRLQIFTNRGFISCREGNIVIEKGLDTLYILSSKKSRPIHSEMGILLFNYRNGAFFVFPDFLGDIMGEMINSSGSGWSNYGVGIFYGKNLRNRFFQRGGKEQKKRHCGN
jgi:hypothetical protein